MPGGPSSGGSRSWERASSAADMFERLSSTPHTQPVPERATTLAAENSERLRSARDSAPTASPRPGGGAREFVEEGAAGRDLEIEDVRDHPRPSVEEIGPSILDGQVARALLRAGLVEKEKVAAVVEFPNDAALGEPDCVGQW